MPEQCSYRLGMDLKLILHTTITISGKRSLVIDQSFKRLFLMRWKFHNVSFTPLYKGVKTCRLDNAESKTHTTIQKRQNSEIVLHQKFT